MVPSSDQCNERRRVTSVLPTGGKNTNWELGTGVQAIKLSPYRAGLAEPVLQRFGTVAALPTCCFPPRLSLRGGSVGPRTFSEFFPDEPGILCRVTRRTESLARAHLPDDGGAPVGFEGEGRAPDGVGLRPQRGAEQPGERAAVLRGPVEGRVGLHHLRAIASLNVSMKPPRFMSCRPSFCGSRRTTPEPGQSPTEGIRVPATPLAFRLNVRRPADGGPRDVAARTEPSELPWMRAADPKGSRGSRPSCGASW